MTVKQSGPVLITSKHDWTTNYSKLEGPKPRRDEMRRREDSSTTRRLHGARASCGQRPAWR